MCAKLGYPVYSETVTHGIGPIGMTLDLYNHEKESYKMLGDDCPGETCVYGDGGESMCCTPGEMCIPKIGCRC